LEAGVLDEMLAGLRMAAAGYDVVVLDLGAGIDRGVRRMSVFADTLLVVATDEPTSLTDAYAVLKLYASDAGAGRSDARIVVNQAANVAAGQRTFDALANACRKFLGQTPRLAGIIRRDEHVREAIRRQALLLVRHPGASAATDVEALAVGLELAPPTDLRLRRLA
jgi:flagellar biosynthesis protein FlhG